MAYRHPCDSGCWFCHTDDETNDWMFSTEFDAYLHKHCLMKEISLLSESNDQEVEIIAKELGCL